ncbi:MAG TPA: GH92 family glycosyl hydrolase [Mycobacteriales bacterium]|nr:GH92 family glycosyl hydrolase [Mycobacteriales bacterium]
MGKLRYVNPLQGTDSTFEFSNGNTLPLVARPFGMASWTPQTTAEGERWFFHPSHRRCYGLRLTHQPSPWISDYGRFTLMPTTERLRVSPVAASSSFDPAQLTVEPGYLGMDLLGSQVRLETAPTDRGAAIRLTYRLTDEPRVVFSSFPGESQVTIDPERRQLRGFTRSDSGSTPEDYAQYFVAEFDCGIDAATSGTFGPDFEPAPELSATGERRGAYVGLVLPPDGVVNVRVGTSFISIEQAERNLRREVGEFEAVRAEAEQAWEERLSLIDVEGDDEAALRTFYTCFWRCFLFPHTWHEYDENDAQVHYSPAVGGVRPGPMYCDVGFWDIFRTSLPLYSLLIPEELGQMIEGWVNFYRESGALPRWLSPGERYTMPGTLIDVVIADAYVKGIRNFDVDTAYEGLLKHSDGTIRPGMQDYLEFGFLPHDRHGESVNNTLDFLYGDFCIAQIAADRGDTAAHNRLIERSRKYELLFDAGLGFMRGRNSDGSRQEPFDPLQWGDPFCEGGAWQCSWAVPFDIRGLAGLMGGAEALVARIDELMEAPAVFKIGSYDFEIHEMSEMAAGGLGQFAISNQPSFHIPFLYAAVGRPDRTQYWVRRTLAHAFSAEPDGLPGDEDNGSTAAWYVWGALGLYPLCPGVPEYVLGSPLFRRATVHLPGGDLVIEAPGNSAESVYWDRLEFDGMEFSRLAVPHADLARGGTLRFRMSNEPAQADYSAEQLPYSLS